MFKIDKGVAIPDGAGQESKYPFDKMDVGDSFAYPFDDGEKIMYAAYRYCKKNPGVKFARRRVDDAHGRVWRIS